MGGQERWQGHARQRHESTGGLRRPAQRAERKQPTQAGTPGQGRPHICPRMRCTHAPSPQHASCPSTCSHAHLLDGRAGKGNGAGELLHRERLAGQRGLIDLREGWQRRGRGGEAGPEAGQPAASAWVGWPSCLGHTHSCGAAPEGADSCARAGGARGLRFRVLDRLNPGPRLRRHGHSWFRVKPRPPRPSAASQPGLRLPPAPSSMRAHAPLAASTSRAPGPPLNPCRPATLPRQASSSSGGTQGAGAHLQGRLVAVGVALGQDLDISGHDISQADQDDIAGDQLRGFDG